MMNAPLSFDNYTTIGLSANTHKLHNQREGAARDQIW